MSTVGENQLQRIIRDLHDAVSALSKEHCETAEPITDDSPNLHKFCYKLEYLLQFDQKEKRTFLGSRKDYWDYFCDCLAKIKGTNDGIRFVKSISELKTSLGKGRSFIRYCLVHQRLADTLQQCVMNYKITCDWYYERSPFLKSHLNTDIINHLYELNEVQFDVTSRGHDLDSDWPTFARKTLGSAVSSHAWKPPSRCSSVTSLQTQEFISGQDFGSSLLGDLGELGELSCSASENFRLELDQSELKQQELLEKIRLLTNEAADLRAVVKDLEEQLSAAKSPDNRVQSAVAEQKVFKNVRECTDRLQTTTQELEALRLQEASERNLEAKLNVAENRNMELLAKLDGALSEKGQQAASYCDSAWTIQELLTKLKEAEQEKIECRRLAERLAQELKQQEVKLKEVDGKLDAFNTTTNKERAAADELQMTVNRLQGALSLKDRETDNLCTQLQDLQSALKMRESHLEEMNGRTQAELQQKGVLEERLKAKESELTVCFEKIRKVESDNERLAADGQSLQTQARKLEEYKNQCTSLMEINTKLIQTVKRNEESSKGLAQTKNGLERELMTARASETQLRTRLESAGLSVENQHLEECVLNGHVKNDETRESSSSPDIGESTSRLALAEAQLDLNMKEVCRLQEEVLELRARLLVSSEERVKIQTLQEVTEVSREDLRAQTEQLKSQVEELNCKHVDELMRCREREETLVKERDKEAKAQARLQTEANAMREELHEVKKHNNSLLLENGEAREALHRANTETAELGVHVCMLTGQNKEAELRWEEMSVNLQERQTEAQEELQTLSESLEDMKKDNSKLQEQLRRWRDFLKSCRSCRNRLNEELDEQRKKLDVELEKVLGLESKVSELESVNSEYSQMIEKKNNRIGDSETVIDQKEEQIKTLRENLSNFCVGSSIGSLIFGAPYREKDALWQKSDALEFEQKRRALEQTDRDLAYCLSCHNHFSWILRKHNCRLCGRPFCYNCCNYAVSGQQGGTKERCCKDCYTQQSHPQTDPGSPLHPPYSTVSSPTRTSTPGVKGELKTPQPDDTVFDIISEDEVSGVHDNSLYTTALSETGHLDITNTEESDELIGSVQDAEICLLKSGEMTLSASYSLEDVVQFGEGFRELFIKSSCYSVVLITAAHPGPTISWIFSSDPKSIAFSVVYRENTGTALEQAKVRFEESPVQTEYRDTGGLKWK
ncbi:FYVE and coiled-coil domain-containing protein 1 [Triplophysa tibetana]|uniref:FYVE and coiled-coil domain-containing protein 1 n=1 Tax=Triplophysa tibetana TaxID=1572043 RepID=A0A5A9PCK0_9TELE|nr:FYVE and coiled-coil domain-containing protein 1 [Triplophysa tibetana]